ncbi:hypothetical protein ACTQ54_12300 [Fundicoccus sp. Sow4_H7]|uniref:hypothetical protein n=1 Tax=Fundicoccus sp. Sow4_H7 TaxID=3438784 RepID=UPI003F8EB001
MTEKANKTVRKQITDAGLTYWQVADKAGVTAGTLTLWLRTPLNKDRKQRIDDAIKTLKERRG